ncbi:uncharacterized protein LOC116226468 [Phasianus colchicus]|uniref:uncharacterized protein LOC116226468 n=1 Tax=Phasianus colchicus TaxID=9054 RepID=UPI00129DA551|nr:uncharacterized protein LOC116226468 [Phasianus colchicus]
MSCAGVQSPSGGAGGCMGRRKVWGAAPYGVQESTQHHRACSIAWHTALHHTTCSTWWDGEWGGENRGGERWEMEKRGREGMGRGKVWGRRKGDMEKIEMQKKGWEKEDGESGENRDAENGDWENGAGTRSSSAVSPRAQHPRAPPRALSYRAPISQGDGPGCAQCTLRFGTRFSSAPAPRSSPCTGRNVPGILLSAVFSVFSSSPASIEGRSGGGGRTVSFLLSLLCCSVSGQSPGFGTSVTRPCLVPLGQRLVAAPMQVFWSISAGQMIQRQVCRTLLMEVSHMPKSDGGGKCHNGDVQPSHSNLGVTGRWSGAAHGSQCWKGPVLLQHLFRWVTQSHSPCLELPHGNGPNPQLELPWNIRGSTRHPTIPTHLGHLGANLLAPGGTGQG